MILATNNNGKIKEIKEILKDYPIFSLKEKNINIEVEENESSFYGNALKKAKSIYNITKEPVIADDSGLCITSLNDFPGVFTHRFLGEKATDEERNAELIARVDKTGNRHAKIICNLVYYDGINTIVGTGKLEGNIAKYPRGTNGFGFDPIFELKSGKTLAELTLEGKNKISARYLATIDLRQKMNDILKIKN